MLLTIIVAIIALFLILLIMIPLISLWASITVAEVFPTIKSLYVLSWTRTVFDLGFQNKVGLLRTILFYINYTAGRLAKSRSSAYASSILLLLIIAPLLVGLTPQIESPELISSSDLVQIQITTLSIGIALTIFILNHVRDQSDQFLRKYIESNLFLLRIAIVSAGFTLLFSLGLMYYPTSDIDVNYLLQLNIVFFISAILLFQLY